MRIAAVLLSLALLTGCSTTQRSKPSPAHALPRGPVTHAPKAGGQAAAPSPKPPAKPAAPI